MNTKKAISFLRNSFLLSMIFIAPFNVISCDSPSEGQKNSTTIGEEARVRDIGPDKFSAEMKQEDVVILDVRTPGEYKDGHLENAILIDFYSPDFEQKVSELDKSKTYFVYCHSGNRSSQAANLMKKKGFTGLVNLEGGITSWRREGYPVEK